MFISVRQLCRAWVAYQQRHIRIMDLWVWFAAHELVARRCQVKPGQAVHYTEGELTRLLGGKQNMPQSLRRLADADLLHWDETQLTFPDDRSPTGEAEAVTAMLEQIPNAHRRIPVPRRMIRYIAGGCHRVSCGHTRGPSHALLVLPRWAMPSRGHCKATWIAEVFGVSLRQVKQARQMLEDIGLLARHDATAMGAQFLRPRHHHQFAVGGTAVRHQNRHCKTILRQSLCRLSAPLCNQWFCLCFTCLSSLC